MLGCPNMPVAPLTDSDGGSDAAGRVGTDGIGVLFTAQQGCGAFVAPLLGVLRRYHPTPPTLGARARAHAGRLRSTKGNENGMVEGCTSVGWKY